MNLKVWGYLCIKQPKLNSSEKNIHERFPPLSHRLLCKQMVGFASYSKFLGVLFCFWTGELIILPLKDILSTGTACESITNTLYKMWMGKEEADYWPVTKFSSCEAV